MRASRVCLALLFFMATASWAEPVKVWVSLRDKGPGLAKTSRNERAYENNPVYKPYLEQLRGAGFAVAVTLKWQNRVSGWAQPSDLASIRALSFVTGVEEFPRKAPRLQPTPSGALPKSSKSFEASFGAYTEVSDSMGATILTDTLAAHHLPPGAGIKIAVIDEDFFLGHSAFDSLFAQNRIVDQWDFVDNGPVAVSRTLGAESHGAWTLSQMAANLPGIAVGLAPHAKYLLYRTEIGESEGYVEEDYLAAALERAVDSGAQVINVSLGYRYDFDSDGQIPYKAMDGRTRPSSIAALGAARRGVMVVVAIGNEGLSRPDSGGGPATPTVVAPADADSILSVGILRHETRCDFSSTGPTFDGRIKPELSSIGLGSGCEVYLINPGTQNAIMNNRAGTSFAAPVVAGIAALLRQLHPDSATNMQKIRRALMVTARHSDNPNNLVGNGLARAGLAHCALLLNSMVQDPVCLTPEPPTSVKGMMVWRGGNVNTLPWPNTLDLTRVRMWDMQGRSYPLRGSLNDDGDVVLQSGRLLSRGAFILRIPKLGD